MGGGGGKGGREGGERLPPPHGEVVPSGLPGCLAPARLPQGWQPPGENTAAGHPSSTGNRPGSRCRRGVPTGSPPCRDGGIGGEQRRSGAGSGGSRGSTGAGGGGRAGGGGGFLAAGFAAELVVAGDGAVASQDLHLAEDGLVPKARLPCRGTEKRQTAREMTVALGSHPLHLAGGPKGNEVPPSLQDAAKPIIALCPETAILAMLV